MSQIKTEYTVFYLLPTAFNIQYLHISTISYNSVRKVGQCLFPTRTEWQFTPQSDNSAVITCSHSREIEASALYISAPQADKLMGRKGH